MNDNAPRVNCSRTCHNEMHPFEVNRTEFRSVARYASLDEMQIGITVEGPVVTSFRVYTDSLYYRAGVYGHVEGTLIGRHAVETTGWGVLDIVGFWEVSNFRGTKWSRDGSFLIWRGGNECIIEDYIAAGRGL